MKKFTAALTALLLILLLSACAENKVDADGTEQPATVAATQAAEANPTSGGYRQISQEEAMQIMQSGRDYILLDVRTPEEYAGGHIPGAICISHDSIPTGDIPELPDKDQLILIYCRSGRRSKLAAEQLAKQGYTDIAEFGGINTWQGEITTE